MQKNFNLLNMATLEGSDGLSARSHFVHDNSFSGNGLPLFEQHQNLDSVPHFYGTKYLLEPATSVQRSLCPTFSPDSMGKVERQQQIGLRFKVDELVLKKPAPVGGRVRILRHLRCEVAYVIEKHCKGEPKAALEFEQFELLYELEMGHALVCSHYGFASLKSLLQSMPDIVALRSISPVTADWRIYPHVKVSSPSTSQSVFAWKIRLQLHLTDFQYPADFLPIGKWQRNGEGRKSRTNFSRQDLRCILYKILHSVWPLGIPKEHLSSEHCKLTGRPLVLVAYEYWKLSDLMQSMGDMLYIDVKNKHVYLVDGAPEPQGLHARENNGWN